ncbi:hypothetical protein Bhyg_06227 [Pseudolycoriella hygida]|uniref:Uncharacterized protein n=1 Tax=Pseudolycoriella hygida TaxID=35572 RepID=A0A9Q0N185_9DIPT|nr:hypothetical protein Bhyg_06227 [Pseudolycoriella hygida]
MIRQIAINTLLAVKLVEMAISKKFPVPGELSPVQIRLVTQKSLSPEDSILDVLTWSNKLAENPAEISKVLHCIRYTRPRLQRKSHHLHCKIQNKVRKLYD